MPFKPLSSFLNSLTANFVDSSIELNLSAKVSASSPVLFKLSSKALNWSLEPFKSLLSLFILLCVFFISLDILLYLSEVFCTNSACFFHSSEPLPKVCVTIANKYQFYTNKQGEYKITLPIEQQDVVQEISIFKEGYIPITKEEIPSDNAIFVLFENKNAYE